VYVAFPVAAGDGHRVIDAARVLGVVGLSVTMPHKKAVIDGLDRVSPIARRLQTRGLPQIVAVTLVYLAMLLLLGLTGLLLFPNLADQIQRLIDQTPGYTTELEALGQSVLDQLQAWGLRVQDINLNSFYGAMGDQVKNVGGSVLTFVSGLASFLFNSIIVLLLSFYFMKDGDRLFNNTVALLPRPFAEELQLMGNSIARAFGGFLRGQVVFAFLYAFVNALIMGAFKLDYILIASIVAGLVMVIPLLGGFLAYLPPLLIMLVTPGAAGGWWFLLLVLFIVQTLMVQVVSPRIMSQAVGMHPLFVVAALLVGLQLAGPWGALFGIPIAGVMHQVGGPYFARLRGFFNVPAPGEPALALQGMVPLAPVTVIAPEPPRPLLTPEHLGPPATLFLLARTLSRRAISLRRRARP